jgi:hypothetical protein
MATETFTREVLQSILEEKSAVISDTISGVGRWTVNHTLIFSYNNKLYRTYYRVGATEMQDERPFEYDTTITCQEVEQVVLTGYVDR